MPWASRWRKAPNWWSSRQADRNGRNAMGKFIIEPHFRLQEWVAEEKGYFKAEGLDYEFLELVQSTDGQHHQTANKSGAYHLIEEARKSDVSCACHWTVNVAASTGHTRLYAEIG